MKIQIWHYKNKVEFDLCISFLYWQDRSTIIANYIDDLEVFKENKGRGEVVKIQINDDIVWGFKGLVKFWEDNGLWHL